MSKLESVLVGLFIGITCPLLIFVGFWWSAALLHRYLPDFPLQFVIASAVTGLCVGMILDVLFLKNWVPRFYTTNIWLMGIIYIALSIAAVAFFMGLPVGTIILGILAGIYMGRRACHAQIDLTMDESSLRKTSLAAGAVTSMAAFPIGLLALNEDDILEMLQSLLGIWQLNFRGWAGFTLIGLLCIFLYLIQYWLSKQVGYLAYHAGKRIA